MISATTNTWAYDNRRIFVGVRWYCVNIHKAQVKMGSSDAKKLNKMKRNEAKRDDDDGAQEVKKGETFGSKNESEFYLDIPIVCSNKRIFINISTKLSQMIVG